MNRIEQLKAEQQERNAKDGGYPSATWLNDALTEALSIAERAVEHLRGFLAAMEWDENARQFLEELETK